MGYLDSILFAILLIIGFGYFYNNIKKIIRNINLGIDIDRKDNPKARWKNMAKIALGQSKMVKRPVSGLLHIIVYVGFVIINIELLEIIIDGLFGTHRIFAFLGASYDFLIGSFEILAFLVLLAVFVFWIRRNGIKIKRFVNKDLAGFPKNDALYILYFEMILMSLFLLMNATDVPFLIEGKRVIFIDDVLFTGRSVRAALDAMNAFGRPAQVELLALIDRKYTRELPIQADYIGIQINSMLSQEVIVEWEGVNGKEEDNVWLLNHK